jgi:hypothetical protein
VSVHLLQTSKNSNVDTTVLKNRCYAVIVVLSLTFIPLITTVKAPIVFLSVELKHVNFLNYALKTNIHGPFRC